MVNNNTKNNNSLGFASILTLIFITLKLTNFITWSWLWVLSPLLISIALILVILVVVIIVAIIKK